MRAIDRAESAAALHASMSGWVRQPVERAVGGGGVAEPQGGDERRERVGALGEHAAGLAQGLPPRIPRDERGREERHRAAHEPVDAAHEDPAGRRREKGDEHGLHARRDRERGVRRQQSRDQQRRQDDDEQLPRPAADAEQQHLAQRDPDGHADRRLEHAHGPRVAHEAEARDRDGRREQRGVVA
ncbi:hypothetical protein, partial [Clavibacter michiganensis]|uniref:hypothetical protein n=1 Tax=Clavibacter michiganensis TaxID=28447 RepID=UPI003743EEBB